MRAILCKSHGPAENLCLEVVDDLIPAEDEAIVEVYSAALNFPDGLQIQGKYLIIIYLNNSSDDRSSSVRGRFSWLSILRMVHGRHHGDQSLHQRLEQLD